jgi:ketosteroid isomerase-like protein
MRAGDTKGVRKSMSVRGRTRRTPEERIALRFPRMRRSLARAIWSLPARSRLRRALLQRAVRLCIDAVNRRDLESGFALFASDSESIFPPELATLGERGPRGRQARIRWEQRWRTDWGEFHYLPEEFVDLGDRILLLGRISGSGSGSGAAVDNEWGMIITPVGGELVREQVFLDRQRALEAAGVASD